TQTYLFAFGPLSGMADIVKGLPGTQPASVFNSMTGNEQATIGAPQPGDTFNGAVGLVPDPEPPLNSSNQPICPNGGGAGACLTGHVNPRMIMDVGVLNGSQPAPLMAIDEDDEFFLTLTNVGQVMRPDLFEQHTVHFHGYPNASAFYDGVPDASVAINIGGSFTYYYLAPDAGTYFWHCHITPPEHLQMGMVGQIYVRPRQNRVHGDLYTALQMLNQPPANTSSPTPVEYQRLRTRCTNDILCSNPVPAINTGATNDGTKKYAYNDGDGSTAYDVEYPIQMHGFDPNFHFVGMTFNPESFTDLKDKYFLLNGRSYPDTINPEPLKTQATDTVERTSQPLSALIRIPAGGKALLRISDLNVSEYHTLAALGIPMKVIALNAKLLRDQDGNNLYYNTNSITLAGGESLDVILDASGPDYAGCTASTPCRFYLYTPQMDHLSNDAENFGGMMTEIIVGPSA
ncbi:MAG TPA: multicopper oxidase domain-containing protein, partial [Povalibacter sp.]|nr:multicopper oxidase domain-containing protein [Povalibacter sp.]